MVATYVYDDFRVTFTPRADGAYDVRAEDDEGRITTGQFSVPMTEGELERTVVHLGSATTRRATALADRPPAVTLSPETGLSPAVTRDIGGEEQPQLDAERLGRALSEALLDGDVGIAYERARHRAESRERGVRLSLSLTKAPALVSVPWEFLFRPPCFLASQRRTPLVRLLESGSLAAAPAITDRVRVLGIVASPSDQAPLDVGGERRRVEEALAPVVEAGRVQLDWLDPATTGSLRRALRDGSYHVLHFVGHGDFTDAGVGVLYLEDDEGRAAAVDDTLFANLLADQDALRLVVLNSCEGARTTLTDPYAGVATTLVQLGVPAVVAMQFPISDRAAILFAEELYTNLIGRQDPVDASVAEARKAIFSELGSTEFATPVLFVRDPDVELFRFEVPVADQLADRTGDGGDDTSGSGASTTVKASLLDRLRRPRLLLAAAIVAVLALGALAVALFSGDDDGDAATSTTVATTTPPTTSPPTQAPAQRLVFPSVGDGTSGAAVNAVQLLLRHHGADITPSGFFDRRTDREVRAFERANDLPIDGLVGPLTWEQLVVTTRPGHRGDAVRAVQTLLNVGGHRLDIDGQYGEATRLAVVRFQNEHTLHPDGIVGADTWKQLLNTAVE